MEKLTVDELIRLKKEDLKGKVICFPTDTVYGIGTLFEDAVGIEKIYKMKNRSKDKPLANLCSSISQITDLGINIPEIGKTLMDKYWPGALTIILSDKDRGISFRMPDSIIALKILNRFSVMPTTSVNESGEPELNSFSEINALFGNDIDYFVTDQAKFSKVPSTVVDISTGKLIVLRQGSIQINI